LTDPEGTPAASGGDTVLVRYFALLDRRRTDELVEMFAPDGVMITKGGTGGEPLCGQEALGEFFRGRGPATACHVVTQSAQTGSSCMAEGLVRPLEAGGESKFFLASALLDGDGLILRYTTLVWTDLNERQERALLRSSP
jgi:hypothetical protein